MEIIATNHITHYAQLGGVMLQIMICDDNPVFSKTLSDKIMSLPSYSSKSMCIKSVSDAHSLDVTVFENCDLLFLDIDLSGINGLELARKMRENNHHTILIFVTNYNEYAPAGYEVDAFRYIDKSELDEKLPQYFSDALKLCRSRQQRIEITCRGESLPIPLQSIIYIESLGREQCLHLSSSQRKEFYTRQTMSNLEDLLSQHGFLRIHKGFLVNMAYLQSLQSTGAILLDGTALPVGARSYRENKHKFVLWQAEQLW